MDCSGCDKKDFVPCDSSDLHCRECCDFSHCEGGGGSLKKRSRTRPYSPTSNVCDSGDEEGGDEEGGWDSGFEEADSPPPSPGPL